jgi:PilZ domain
MSPGGLALLAPGIGNVGDRVIAYLDHIGRVEGKITRIIDNGFAMSVGATARKRDKLAAQLTWLANRELLGSIDDRRHGRVAPRNAAGRLTLPNGNNISVRILDVSQSGCAIATDQRPGVGTQVTIGKTAGRVVRHLEDGFAIEYLRLQHPDFIEDNVTGG